MFINCSQFGHTPFILTSYDENVQRDKRKHSIHTLPFTEKSLTLGSFFFVKNMDCTCKNTFNMLKC